MPDESEIICAAEIIKAGGIVAFPTETVYGLGANASDARAVAKIYELKGRPSDNPLIVHVNCAREAERFAVIGKGCAKKLADAFWPGPLTLVLKKKRGAPPWLGGHPQTKRETVAVRVSADPVARSLIEYSGCPIAAPSANKSGRVSPTRSSHVRADFGNELDFIIEGEASGGLESTVIDATGPVPKILRPGFVTAEMAACVTGTGAAEITASFDSDGAPVSPGTKYKHYAPDAKLRLVTGEPEAAAAKIIGEIESFGNTLMIGVIATEQTARIYKERLGERAFFIEPDALPEEPTYAANIFNGKHVAVTVAGDRLFPETIAKSLYRCMRGLDRFGVSVIFAEGIDESGIGRAIMNRLEKASACGAEPA